MTEFDEKKCQFLLPFSSLQQQYWSLFHCIQVDTFTYLKKNNNFNRLWYEHIGIRVNGFGLYTFVAYRDDILGIFIYFFSINYVTLKVKNLSI